MTCPSNICHVLPPIAQIELGLDYTKVWYANEQATKLAKLDYIPMVVNIFNELTRQANMAFHILPKEKLSQEDFILPLRDAKEHDQYKMSRYMQSIKPSNQNSASRNPNDKDKISPPPPNQLTQNTPKDLPTDDTSKVSSFINLPMNINPPLLEHPKHIGESTSSKIISHTNRRKILQRLLYQKYYHLKLLPTMNYIENLIQYHLKYSKDGLQ